MKGGGYFILYYFFFISTTACRCYDPDLFLRASYLWPAPISSPTSHTYFTPLTSGSHNSEFSSRFMFSSPWQPSFFFSRSSKCFSCVPSSRERRCFTRDNSYHNGRRTERQNKPISRPQANNPVSLSLKPFFLTMLIEMRILLWEMFGAVYVRDFVL